MQQELSKTMKKNSESTKVSRKTVRLRIQEAILNGKYAPGTRLNQLKVSKQLGVSVGLVREALFELKSTGLVDTIDNRGIFVSKITLSKLRELYDIREIHEGFAARYCCGKLKESEIKKLRNKVTKIRDLAQKGNNEKAASLDRDLHFQIIKMSGHGFLRKLAETHVIAGKIIWTKEDPEVNFKSHMEILDAIENNLPDQAETLMRKHIRHGADLIEKYVQQEGLILHWIQ